MNLSTGLGVVFIGMVIAFFATLIFEMEKQARQNKRNKEKGEK